MPKVSTSPTSRAWVEVDLEALRENYRTIARNVASDVALIPMVKADAYGLGVERVVHALRPLDPWGFGVATASEGAELRAAGIQRPVLTFSPLPADVVPLAAEAELTPAISELGALDRWARAAELSRVPLGFQIEVDTGMGRCGFDWRRTREWAPEVFRRLGPGLRLTGVFTHFQGADAPAESPSRVQWDRYQEALGAFRECATSAGDTSRGGAGDPMTHASNSAAALRWPEYGADAVRPGIFLYGGNPWGRLPAGELPAPRTVVAVRARVVLVRTVEPGATVGYGATHRAERRERWATLSIGYGDGLPRGLGNRGHALIGGRRVPIIGRVSMDLTVIDVTEMDSVEHGDVATLVGVDGSETIPLEEVAHHAGTINYEILTGLTQRLPRITSTPAARE